MSRLLAGVLCLVLAACADRGYSVRYDPFYDPAEFARAAADRDLTLKLHGVESESDADLILSKFRDDLGDWRETALTEQPDDSVRLPYSLVILVDPSRLLAAAAICRGARPDALGAGGPVVRVQSVLCRADKPLMDVVGDATDASRFDVDAFYGVVGDIVRLAGDPPEPE